MHTQEKQLRPTRFLNFTTDLQRKPNRRFFKTETKPKPNRIRGFSQNQTEPNWKNPFRTSLAFDLFYTVDLTDGVAQIVK